MLSMVLGCIILNAKCLPVIVYLLFTSTIKPLFLYFKISFTGNSLGPLVLFRLKIVSKIEGKYR